MLNNNRKYPLSDYSVSVEESLGDLTDSIPDELLDSAQEYIETRAESDDMHWHQENVDSWH